MRYDALILHRWQVIKMELRTENEMIALISAFHDQLGPLDKWSQKALENLSIWLNDTGIDIENEWVRRNNEAGSDF
jgi:hypothetical protein